MFLKILTKDSHIFVTNLQTGQGLDAVDHMTTFNSAISIKPFYFFNLKNDFKISTLSLFNTGRIILLLIGAI